MNSEMKQDNKETYSSIVQKHGAQKQDAQRQGVHRQGVRKQGVQKQGVQKQSVQKRLVFGQSIQKQVDANQQRLNNVSDWFNSYVETEECPFYEDISKNGYDIEAAFIDVDNGIVKVLINNYGARVGKPYRNKYIYGLPYYGPNHSDTGEFIEEEVTIPQHILKI